MKKSLFLAVCLLLASAPAMADIAASVMLRHNGQTTFFSYDQIQNAVDAAAEGDTIYLTEGTFSPFNIDKRIMVRGAGYTTMIQGDCNIDISGTAKLTKPVLDAMCFTGNINVNSAYDQFTLRKVKANDINFGEGEYYDVKIDRCHVYGTFHLKQEVKEFNAFNSKIATLHPYDYTSGHATFDHCGIQNINDTITATFNSCAISNARALKIGSTQYNAALIGCVLNSCAIYNYNNMFRYSSSTVLNNCTSTTALVSNATDFNNDGYISALDGTKIGAYGGQHPFTQWPEVPAVTKHNVTVDAANKKLNVTLTVEKYDKEE